jgi:formiminoglutamase
MKNEELVRHLHPEEAGFASLIATREGERRIGEGLLFRADGSDEWKKRKFHVIGLQEDAGPRLNKGLPGSAKAFGAFIQRFMTVQSNRFLDGSQIALHGILDVSTDASDELLENVVKELDIKVAAWVSEVVRAGGVPIVIGGGHNNAYGIIRGCAEALGKAISVVNLDPHADTRDPGIRHSGNPFTYAWNEKHLSRYCVLGLHESYNNEAILRRLEEMGADAVWFESWIDQPGKFFSDVDEKAAKLAGDNFGIELDLDSIAGMPSSAYTPSGVSVEQARYYVRRMAAAKGACYLHLPEGAPQSPREEAMVGKALCYFVTDFVKSM